MTKLNGASIRSVFKWQQEVRHEANPRRRRMGVGTGARVVGAELLHPRGLTIEKMDDLPRLLSEVLGPSGRNVFYLGIFGAVFTSLVGQSLGLALMGAHAWIRWKENRNLASSEKPGFSTGPRYENHRLYRWIVVWCVVSPLVWTVPGMPDFVTLTLLGNAVQVVLLPLLAGTMR